MKTSRIILFLALLAVVSCGHRYSGHERMGGRSGRDALRTSPPALADEPAKPAQAGFDVFVFPLDAWKGDPEIIRTLDQAAARMMKDPALHMTIEGHTWDVGRERENLIRTKQEADEVRRFILGGRTLDPKRVISVGYGGQRPLESNATPDGRKRNRRIRISMTRVLREEQTRFTLLFPSGSVYQADEMDGRLLDAAKLLLRRPGSTARIEGHSDNLGEAENNLKLSRARAETVLRILRGRFGVAGSRLRAVGYGESEPVADNSSRRGRELNRRVEIVVSSRPEGEAEAQAPPKARNYRIEVSVSKCRLWLFELESGGVKKLLREYEVATAKKGTPYPEGLGLVTKIDMNPWWRPTANMKRAARKRGRVLSAVKPGSPNNPMGAFKIHLSHGNAYRIHGTNKPGQIGRRVSLGCVRMRNDEGKELAQTIGVGAEVDIHY